MAKASRAGRVTRVIRIIRIIRLIRIVKLYKQTVIAQKKAQEFQYVKNKSSMLKGLEIKKPMELEIEECDNSHSHHDHDKLIIESIDSDGSDQFFTEESSESSGSDEEKEQEEEIEIPEESNISKTLSDNTTRTVIILVLSLLIMQSVCNHETYLQPVLVHTQAFA